MSIAKEDHQNQATQMKHQKQMKNMVMKHLRPILKLPKPIFKPLKLSLNHLELIMKLPNLITLLLMQQQKLALKSLKMVMKHLQMAILMNRM